MKQKNNDVVLWIDKCNDRKHIVDNNNNNKKKKKKKEKMVAASIVTGLNPMAVPLTLFIVQLLLIVVISRLLYYVLSYVQQPPVISEVITGILLGPSVLGISKAFSQNVFPASSLTVLNVIANVGLIFFMFMVGLEVDPTILKKNLKSSMIISLSSIILPFAMGIGLAAILYDKMVAEDEKLSFPLFCVFVGVAISITAFPVLARILTERGLMTSKVGVTSLAAASVDDVIAWILLAFVVSFANNLKTDGPDDARNRLSALWTFILLIGFIVLMFGPVRMGLAHIFRKYVKTESHKHQMVVALLMLMFMSAFYTEVIGVHAIFGAFILGVIVPRHDGFHHMLTERIQDVTTIVLLPLYFTFSGLRTKLNSIDSGVAGGCTVLIIVFACFGKIVGATFASRFCKNTWRESITVGFLMNTKGLVELIVLNIGYEIGILNQTLFSMFVVMALATTFMTTPAVYFIWTRWENRQSRVPMVPRAAGKFNILLYPTQVRLGSVMTAIAAAITSPKATSKKYKISSVYATEAIGDRPSTYFFNSLKNLPPAKREIYEAIQEEATTIGVVVKPIVMSSVDIASDIRHVAKTQWPDLVLMGWTRNDRGSEMTQSSTVMESFSNMGAQSADAPFYGKVIVNVLEHVKSAVGVVVDKGLDRFNKKHNILFPYSGQTYENDAITLVLKMARRSNITITILTNQVEQTRQKIVANEKLDINQFTINASDDPHQEALAKAKDQDADYWLVVVGLPREDSVRQEQLVTQSAHSLLIVHPSNQLLEIQNLGNGQLKMSCANLTSDSPQTIELPQLDHHNNQ
ncbi:Na+/H+ antiporter [Cavenderia fasciculata]|uniref:Na+/H+ antiporter n=1 Tax=Cavenderia fasciculata TaxID=261658 RepID=F4QD53_CACFS|nr:Na+/H+ antiporter [Cavenderia fasciculata]EGG14524.1 Na+/H+ antiporter [Cavenderia fasciculata]|eukprot:XP_004353951.1 Na+/H+ antiporter [Cavenderia fasciculata]